MAITDVYDGYTDAEYIQLGSKVLVRCSVMCWEQYFKIDGLLQESSRIFDIIDVCSQFQSNPISFFLFPGIGATWSVQGLSSAVLPLRIAMRGMRVQQRSLLLSAYNLFVSNTSSLFFSHNYSLTRFA